MAKYRVKDGEVYKMKVGKALHVYGPGRVFETTEDVPVAKADPVPEDTPVSQPYRTFDQGKLAGK